MRNIAILILLLLLYFIIVNNAIVVRYSGTRPAIKNFSVNKIEKKLIFSFNFYDVTGGLENSETVMDIKVTRAEDKTNPFYSVIQIDWRSLDSYHIDNIDKNPSKGRAEFILLVPPELGEYKERDTITFTIYIRDVFGGKSNTVIHKLNFSDKIVI